MSKIFNAIKKLLPKASVKEQLIVISLSPLFLLTAIKNFSFNLTTYCLSNFISSNICILVIQFFCLLWIIASVGILIGFKSYQTNGYEEGYTIKNVTYDNEAGLNYFLTIILPLLIDDLNCIQNTIVFFIVSILIILLLSKTNLFYANPILMILGYKIIKFQFSTQPTNYIDVDSIGICPRQIDSTKVIKFKKIDGNVLCIKQRRNS